MRTTARLGAALTAGAMLLALAPPSNAGETATVNVAGDRLDFVGTSLVDLLTIAPDTGLWHIQQETGIAAGNGCTAVDPTVADCQLTSAVLVMLGGGNDALTFTGPGSLTADGGSGNDKLNVSAATGSTTLVGGAGADTFIGGPSKDTVNARDGVRDSITCGAGADVATIDRLDVVSGCEQVIYPRVRSRVAAAWQLVGPSTVVLKLKASKIPSGGKALVKCSQSASCPFDKKRVPVSDARTATMTRFFHGARLRAGAVVEVRITAPKMIGKVVRYTVRKNKLPAVKTLCLPPGGTRPTAC